MSTDKDNKFGNGPAQAKVDEELAMLEALEDDPEFARRAAQGAAAIAFVHFDPNSAKSNIVEALVHQDDLTKIRRGLYVHILSMMDGRFYGGRIVEGPFYSPDVLKRDSTPIQFIILNQGGKALSLPEYHGRIYIEILGEERDGVLHGVVRRPHPASPVFPFDSAMMDTMLNLAGNIRIGMLDNYDDIFVQVDGERKDWMPRNWLTVGTIGSGKSNTNQVFMEETLAANYAQVVVDPEGEYIFMDQPSERHTAEDLEKYERTPQGVKSLTVYHPPLATSKRADAKPFSVPFDSLPPELIVELVEMSSAQETRFTFLYEQAVQVLRLSKQSHGLQPLTNEDFNLSRGFPGIKLTVLIKMLDQELDYYNWKRGQKADEGKKKTSKAAKEDQGDRLDDSNGEHSSEQNEDDLHKDTYFHKYKLQPLTKDQHDAVSYGALRKKLRELQMTNIFDLPNAPKLDMKELSKPGHLTVIDMSDSDNQQVVNIVIADLLSRMFRYKMDLTEEENTQRKVVLTIEEAHGFVSREKKDKMEQTLDQLRRIARRGRKRWLVLHFVTQSPQHLPSELFELANNKIIHQTSGTENLRVLKVAAGAVNEGIWNDLPSFGRGRAIIVSSQYPHPIITQIRPAASKRNYTL